MALSKDILQQQIYAALNLMSVKANLPNYTPDQARADAARDIANAIDTFVRSATIVIPPGQAVTTTGGKGATALPSPRAEIS